MSINILQHSKYDRHWLILVVLTVLLFIVWLTAKGPQWEGYPCFVWNAGVAVLMTYLGVLLGTVIYFCQLLLGVIWIPERFSRKNILLAFIVFVLLRIILGSALPLLGDEAYHWLWPKNIDWCYYDHGGLTGWVCYPFRLLGKEVFYARLAPILLGTVTAAMVWGFARSLTGDVRIANIALAGLMMLPVGLVGTFILFTDTPLAPIWIGGLWAMLLALRSGKLKWWLVLGVLLGLGLNCKYLIFGLFIMIFCFLLIDQRGRHAFSTPGPYLAVVIALLVSAPMWYWNSSHDWMTFVFNFGKRGHALGFHPTGFIGFSAQQIMLVGPLIFLWSLYYPAIWGWKKYCEGKFEALIPVLGGYIPFMMYAVLKLMRPLNTSVINWTAPLFTLLVIILAWVAMESSQKRKWCKISLHAGAAISCIFVTGFLGEMFIGPDAINKTFAPMVSERKLRHHSSNLFGWYPVGKEVDSLYKEMSKEHPTFILARTYMHAAQLSQYCSSVPLVLSMGDDAMYGRCFDYWNCSEQLIGWDCLFVANHPASGNIVDELKRSFDSVKDLSLNERNLQNGVGSFFHIYYCKNMKKFPSAAEANKKRE
jgi:hypothetical protein